jgi:hypothetical protein
LEVGDPDFDIKARQVGETRALDNGAGEMRALEDAVGERGVEGDASDMHCFLSGVSPSPRGEFGPENGAGGVTLSIGVILVSVLPTRVSGYRGKGSSCGLF